MDEEDDVFPDDAQEQEIRDRIDDEMVNHALMERLLPDDELVRKPPRPPHPPA
jgi:hypothetical protein